MHKSIKFKEKKETKSNYIVDKGEKQLDRKSKKKFKSGKYRKI
jgi:hypothetical protein